MTGVLCGVLLSRVTRDQTLKSSRRAGERPFRSLALSDSPYCLRGASHLPPTLTTLILRDGRCKNANFDAWCTAAAAALAGGDALMLRILNFNWSTADGSSFSRLPFKLHSLIINGSPVVHEALPRMLPAPISTLRTLRLATNVAFSAAHARALVDAVGPHLEELEFKRDTKEKDIVMNVDDYSYMASTRDAIPEELLSPLPRLLRLSIHNKSTMTISKLETLFRGSPQLQKITLHDSTWTFQASSSVGAAPYAPGEFLKSTRALEDALKLAPSSLSRLHLGILPTTVGISPSIKRVADGRGIRLRFQKCVVPDYYDEYDMYDSEYWSEGEYYGGYWCENCGGMHGY